MLDQRPRGVGAVTGRFFPVLRDLKENVNQAVGGAAATLADGAGDAARPALRVARLARLPGREVFHSSATVCTGFRHRADDSASPLYICAGCCTLCRTQHNGRAQNDMRRRHLQRLDELSDLGRQSLAHERGGIVRLGDRDVSPASTDGTRRPAASGPLESRGASMPPTTVSRRLNEPDIAPTRSLARRPCTAGALDDVDWDDDRRCMLHRSDRRGTIARHERPYSTSCARPPSTAPTPRRNSGPRSSAPASFTPGPSWRTPPA